MRVVTLLLCGVLAAVNLTASTGWNYFHWNGRIASGQTVEIRGFHGDVKAERATGRDVEVFAVRRGRAPERLKIDVLDRDGGITLVSSDTGQPEQAAQVEFSVRVPPGVRLVVRTVNGGVSAQGMASDVEAHTLNGKIEISTSKSALAETINGSIVASVGEVRKDGGHTFSSVNGSVVLDFPGLMDADLDVETLNGTIRSEFPCGLRDGTRRLKTTVGHGGPTISVRTSNGSIWLLRTV